MRFCSITVSIAPDINASGRVVNEKKKKNTTDNWPPGVCRDRRWNNDIVVNIIGNIDGSKARRTRAPGDDGEKRVGGAAIRLYCTVFPDPGTAWARARARVRLKARNLSKPFRRRRRAGPKAARRSGSTGAVYNGNESARRPVIIIIIVVVRI